MLPKFSVKRPMTIVVAVILIIILGVVSFSNTGVDLLPEMELPYVVVMTSHVGASPEEVESEVTVPLESTLGLVSGLKSIESSSSENVSMVFMEFDQNINMDSVMVELSSLIDAASAQFPDEAGAPVLQRLNPSMLPVMVMTADMEEMSEIEFSQYVEDELTPAFYRIDGVANIDTMGLVTERVELIWDEQAIKEYNDIMLTEIDRQFAAGLAQLDQAKAELQSAQDGLSSQSDELLGGLLINVGELVIAFEEMEAELAELQVIEDQLISEFGSVEAAEQAFADQQTALDLAYADYQAALVAGDPTQIASAKAVLDDELSNTVDLVNQLAAIFPDAGLSVDPAILSDVEVAYAELSIRLNLGIATLAAYQVTMSETEAAFDELLAQLDPDQGLNPDDTGLELDIMGMISGLATASAQIAVAQAELDKAYVEMEAAREDAFESAGLEGVLTPQMLAGILGAEHFAMPAGYIEDGDSEILLKVGDKFIDIDELADFTIMDIDIAGIGEIKVSDVAAPTITDNSGEFYSIVNGNPGIIMMMQKQSLYSTADVSDSINEVMDQLMATDENLTLSALSDQGFYIRTAVNSVMTNLLIGAALAILALLVFLRSIRPTVIIAFSIPISLLFALSLMYFSGVNINVISMAGLAMGVGMLVDNSIVVIENIYRMRAEGKSAATAAVMGARQVTGAITASTLTTVCVFLPVVFAQGITRSLFADMGLTVAYSLLASLIVALTLIPSAASRLLKNIPEERPMHKKLVDKYSELLAKNLKRKWPIFVFVGAVILFCALAVVRMGTAFIPQVDYGELLISVQGEDETVSEETVQDLSSEVVDDILSIEGVDVVAAFEGSAMMMMESGSDYAVTVYVLLDPDAGVSSDEAIAQINELTADIPAIIGIDSSSSDLSMLGGEGIQLEIAGADTDQLAAITSDITVILEGVEGLTDIDDGLGGVNPELRVIVDKNEAMKNNLTVAQVYQELALEINSEQEIITLQEEGREYPVVITLPSDSALTREKLANFTFEVETQDITGQGGETKTIYLSDIAQIVEAEGFPTINHVNQSRTHTINAEIADGYNIGLVSRDMEDALEEYQMPAGYDLSIRGENEQIMDTMGDLILMLILAATFVYLIMVAQFQSLVLPFIIILTIPLAFSGGLATLVISGMEISIIAMLGFLILAGVIVNNGIVFIDCVNQLRLDGMAKHDALIEAGRRRLRPILMTALTTICSLFALAFSQQMGAELLRPMAVVAMGGLTYATILTLFLVPSLYDIIQRKEIKKVEIDEEE